jgi:hypothetical protein
MIPVAEAVCSPFQWYLRHFNERFSTSSEKQALLFPIPKKLVLFKLLNEEPLCPRSGFSQVPIRALQHERNTTPIEKKEVRKAELVIYVFKRSRGRSMDDREALRAPRGMTFQPVPAMKIKKLSNFPQKGRKMKTQKYAKKRRSRKTDGTERTYH